MFHISVMYLHVCYIHISPKSVVSLTRWTWIRSIVRRYQQCDKTETGVEWVHSLSGKNVDISFNRFCRSSCGFQWDKHKFNPVCAKIAGAINSALGDEPQSKFSLMSSKWCVDGQNYTKCVWVLKSRRRKWRLPRRFSRWALRTPWNRTISERSTWNFGTSTETLRIMRGT